jgi:hypothetical protein
MSFFAEFLASRFVSVRSGYAMKRGSQALASKNYDGAIAAFTEAVAAKTEIIGNRKNVTVAHALLELANAHRLAGNKHEAAQV